jgi:drug/metabolite transporter (DMT)-like permease
MKPAQDLAGVIPGVDRLPLKAVASLLVLSLIWGAGWAVVKMGGRDFAPLFMAGLRSVVAGACLWAWMIYKGVPAFPSRIVVFHGAVAALIFTVEFVLIYLGLMFTLASRVYILLYTAPFFAAVGAHFLLPGDRLNLWKSLGLVLAFSGTALLFVDGLGRFELSNLVGDLMILGGGLMWALSSIYVKKYLMDRAQPVQILLSSLIFSMPLFFAASLIWEKPMVMSVSWLGIFSLFFQSVITAFITYLAWLELMSRYPVSLLHAFSFFTPVFGVFISGYLLLDEAIGWNLIAGLVLVCLGMILVNRRVSSPPLVD